MPGPLESAWSVLANANDHIAKFDREYGAYRLSGPVAKILEDDTKANEKILKLKLIKPVPDSLRTIAFDAVNNLRSVLDQATYAVCMAAGGKGKDTYFPFGDTPAEVKSRHAQASKEIPAPMFAFMESLKPYKGGDDLLWSLNKLCNTEKHRFLVPFAIKSGGLQSIDTSHTGPGNFRVAMNPEWDSTKNEMELARVGEGKWHYNVDLVFFVAFGEIESIAKKEATRVLYALLRKVDGILSGIEVEGRRNGIFP